MQTIKQQTLDTPGRLDTTQLQSTSPGFELPDIPGYVVTRELAHGGMGRVLAGRELLLDREVAIKVLLPDADPERFITESKITARLPHPSIPAVYALGSLANGSPFLAMKLVRGKTLADELKARPDTLHDLPRFLQIFEQIAQAVGFAHSENIIHRDLKPANVMVGAFGEVQVMDWGLAKDLSKTDDLPQGGKIDEAPAEISVNVATVAWEGETPNQQNDQTRSGAILGTPSYMAPEQARGEVVNARADVFALGGILCAILTGKTVFGGTTVWETVQQAAEGDTAEAITRLDSCGADSEMITLVKRCLDVDSSKRPTDGKAVASLVADYRHGVEERLKKAQADEAASRAREIEQSKRRRTVQRAAVLISLILLAGIIGTGIGYFRAEQKAEDERLAKEEANKERSKAIEARQQAVNNLQFAKKGNELLGSVFISLDPNQNYPTVGALSKALRNNLSKTIKELEGTAVGEPVEVAGMQIKLGASLIGLGDTLSAIEVLEKAQKTLKEQLGLNHLDTIESMHYLAWGYHDAGRLELAVPMMEAVLKLRNEKWGTEHPGTIQSMSSLAEAYLDLGKLEKAKPLFEQAAKASKEKLGPEHPDTLRMLGSLANFYRSTDHPALALPLLEENLNLIKAKMGTDHPDVFISMNNLAFGYIAAGRPSRAIPLLMEALKGQKVKLGEDHHYTQTTMINLARGYLAEGKMNEALELLENALKQMNNMMGKEHPFTYKLKCDLAQAYQDAGKVDQAVSLLDDSLKHWIATLGRDHKTTINTMNKLAMAYQLSGKMEKALPLYEESLKLAKAVLGSNHADTFACRNNLAGGYYATGKTDLALPLLEETHHFTRVKLGPEHPNTLSSKSNLALTYLKAGMFDKALPLLEESLKEKKKVLGPEHPDTLSSMNSLAGGYEESGKPELAMPLLQETLRLRKEKLGDSHPNTLLSMNRLATAYQNARKLDLALPIFQEAAAGVKSRKFRDDIAESIITNLINCLEELKQYEPAVTWRNQWLEVVTVQSGIDSPAYAVQLAGLGSNFLHQKKWAEAEPPLRKSLELRQKKVPTAITTYHAMSLLGWTLLEQKQFVEAEPLLLKAYQGMVQRYPMTQAALVANQRKQVEALQRTMRGRLEEILDLLIRLYTETNKPDEVKKWQAEKDKLPKEPAKK